MFHTFSKKRGFTLVELIVSVSLFSIVMVISMGAIFSVLDANKKSQTLRSVLDNLNFTLEEMTRSIRFGENYHCGSSGDTTKPNDCSSGGNSVTIKDSSGNQVTYALSNGQITRSINGGTVFYLTSADVTIQSLTFYVLGSYPYSDPSGGQTDLLQPKMVVLIKGYADAHNEDNSSFTLETTISQRKFDFQ